MKLLYETENTFKLNTSASKLYENHVTDDTLKYLFSKPTLNRDKDKYEDETSVYFFEDAPSSSDNEEDFFEDFLGGATDKPKSKLKKVTKTKTPKDQKSVVTEKESKNFLNVMPSFINVLKGRILYNNKTRLQLEPLKTKSKSVVIGTILDLKKVRQGLNNLEAKLTKKDIIDYVNSFDALAMMFNFDNKTIIYKNRKDTFFSPDSKLVFLTFKVKNETEYYYESTIANPYTEFMNIEDIIQKKNYIVAHFIYENHYMIITKPSNNLIPDKFYFVNIENKHVPNKLLEEFKDDLEYNPNMNSIRLNDMLVIINECNKKLTLFQ